MKEYYTIQEQKSIQYLADNKDKKILFYQFIIDIMDVVALKLDGNKLSIITNENISAEERQNLKYSKAEKSLFETICLLKALMKDSLIELFWYNNNPLDTTNDTVHLIKSEYQYYDKLINEGEISQDGKTITHKVNSIEDFFRVMTAGRYTVNSGDRTIVMHHQTINMLDSSALEFLKLNFNSYIYPTSSLIELNINKFCTPEQIRHEKEMAESKAQTKWSEFAFWLSFAALIITTIIAAC